jgi:uncharacterized protein (DUF2252 family)
MAMAARRHRDVVQSLVQYNRGRDPALLARKFTAMASNPFVFLRGAAHRFYETLDTHALPHGAPLAWICGDLHLENFGSFRGDNRLTYFDLNDFDEAARAPCTFDLLRLLTSIHVGAHSLDMSAQEGEKLCRVFLTGATNELRAGKARWVEREVADGMVARLLGNVTDRNRRQLLDRRAPLVGKHRKLLVDGERYLAATAEQEKMVSRMIEQSCVNHPHPERFRVLSIARRVAGTGSLGLPRFVVLTEGKGSPNRNLILDVKAARPSCVPRVALRWSSDADRVVSVQRQLQAIAPAFLSAQRAGGESYVIKELQPQMDKLNLAECHGRHELLSPTVATMGELVAWSMLRASGWRGAADLDALVAFGERRDWQPQLLRLSATLARDTVEEWRTFRDAWKAGKVDLNAAERSAAGAARKRRPARPARKRPTAARQRKVRARRQ